MSDLISIIIINYKTYKDTCKCIDSILQYTKQVAFEIILVENGTHEFNEENTKHWGAALKLLVSDQNLGFAGGNNLGLKAAQGNYILLLNSDTYLVQDSISEAYQYMVAHDQVGALSVRLNYPDGRPQSVAQRFPHCKYLLMELLRLQKLMSASKRSAYLLGAYLDHKAIVTADWIWGAFFLTRKTLIQKMPHQQFDARYFMYFEDVQWCWDIKQMGYDILYYPLTSIVHIQEASKGKTNHNMLQSEALFFKDKYSPLHFKCIKFLQKILKP